MKKARDLAEILVIRKALPKLFLALALVFVYGRTVGYGFVLFDDDIHVYANEALEHPARFLTKPYQGFYIPLTYSVWAIEKRLFGLRAGGYHAVNVAIHAVSTCLVWALFGGVGAAFWALHPLQVEAVAWVSGLKDLLAGMLALLALWLERRGRPRLALVAFAAALLSKPSAAVAPLLLLALGVEWRKLVPWFGLAAAALVATKCFQSGSNGIAVAWGARPVIALDALGFYLEKLVLPFGLCPDQGHTPAYAVAHFSWLVAMATVGLFALGLWHPRLRRPMLIFLIPLLPVLGLATFFHQFYSTVADRYAYLALLGPAILVGRARWPGAAVVLIAVLTVLSAAQVTLWSGNQTLFTHTLKLTPSSLIARNNLGAVYEHLGRYVEAAEQYRGGVESHPDQPAAHYNLGRMLARQKRFREAREQFEITVRLAPDVTAARDALREARKREAKATDVEAVPRS